MSREKRIWLASADRGLLYLVRRSASSESISQLELEVRLIFHDFVKVGISTSE